MLYRRDERRRILEKGARILSLDQIEGLEPINEKEDQLDKQLDGDEGDELELGEEIDESGDPPRVWSSKGDYPGIVFTRSLGNSIAEELGVFAEPEMVTRDLGQQERIIVLASDGVFEFLTNQSVIDICVKFDDPLEACHAVDAESYELWLQYELRTDDNTMICIFLDEVGSNVSELCGNSKLISNSPPGNISHITSESVIEDVADAPVTFEDSRPVRKYLSKEKTKKIAEMKELLNGEMGEELPEDLDIKQLYTEKTEMGILVAQNPDNRKALHGNEWKGRYQEGGVPGDSRVG